MRERDRQTERLREAAIVCACTLGAMNFSWIVFHCLSVSFSGASLECFGGYLILFKSRFMNHAWSTPAPWYAEFPILQCSISLGGYPKALNSKMLALCRRHSVRMKLWMKRSRTQGCRLRRRMPWLRCGPGRDLLGRGRRLWLWFIQKCKKIRLGRKIGVSHRMGPP